MYIQNWRDLLKYKKIFMILFLCDELQQAIHIYDFLTIAMRDHLKALLRLSRVNAFSSLRTDPHSMNARGCALIASTLPKC